MTRRRLIVLALTLAFVAPWGAACLADAPGHGMACCLSGRTAPMVRPCCAMSPDRTGVTVPAAAQAITPIQPLGALVPPAETRRYHRDALSASVTRPIEIRLLASVFLI
jgi:hypothetical protein